MGKAKKYIYMFLRHRRHHFKLHQTFLLHFTLKNGQYTSNCHLSWLSFAAILFVFGWLVANQLVVHKLLGYFELFEKIKSCPPHHFLKKVPEKHIYNYNLFTVTNLS